MRVLILIMSCIAYAENGINQSLRETWLPTVKKYPNLEYKIALGDGTPVEESEAFKQSWKDRGCRYTDKPTSAVYNGYQPKDDEILLPTPDDYMHLCFKSRAAHLWAKEQGFDFIFHTYSDVYVDVDNLMSSGFEEQAFCGGENGSGFWLNKKANSIALLYPVTVWNDDGWFRDVLRLHGIELNTDSKYVIAQHLTISPEIHSVDRMYKAHENACRNTGI